MPGEDTSPRSPFPVWLKDLCYVGGLIIALVVFGQNLKSDQRSAREQLDRVASDVAAIRVTLPNPEVLNLRFKAIEERFAELKVAVDVESMRSQKLREQLARKGIID